MMQVEESEESGSEEEEEEEKIAKHSRIRKENR